MQQQTPAQKTRIAEAMAQMISAIFAAIRAIVRAILHLFGRSDSATAVSPAPAPAAAETAQPRPQNLARVMAAADRLEAACQARRDADTQATGAAGTPPPLPLIGLRAIEIDGDRALVDIEAGKVRYRVVVALGADGLADRSQPMPRSVALLLQRVPEDRCVVEWGRLLDRVDAGIPEARQEDNRYAGKHRRVEQPSMMHLFAHPPTTKPGPVV